ncbi:MAG: alpha-amylase family protein [Bifidobacterium psychraerophilum]|uniref:alpha-amylase family protein n=1 Tax=Bifidobacterium psychraerophilum TaxID=218140 RepID=UPI0039EB2A07
MHTGADRPQDANASQVSGGPQASQEDRLLSPPSWAGEAVWWHVYPLGFSGATIRPETPDDRHAGRGLDALIPWLDYVTDLGATGLLLGPIFQSTTHGYDTTDFMHIDDRLGGDEAFERLASAARGRGLRIILDGVFNHVGREHPAVAAALDVDPAASSPWHGLIRTIPNTAAQTDSPEARLPVFEGHQGLVELDHDSPATVSYVAEVMNHWLDHGADGWRLDAAYSVTPEFWAKTLPLVREQHPDTWIFGEVIHGDYPAFVQHSTVDSVTQYELWKSIWSSIANGNFFELDWNLQRQNTFLKTFIPQTFIGNHDVTRVASQTGQEGAILALAILMTVGGIPSIYYGDELGMTAIKEERLGGDDAIRPAFPEHPETLDDAARRIFDAHRDLIALRRNHPWLSQAQIRNVHLENRSFVYRPTSADGGQSLQVELSLDPTPHVVINDEHNNPLYDSRQ